MFARHGPAVGNINNIEVPELSDAPEATTDDAMTLHELGITDIDCGLDPDGLLDGPPADKVDAVSDLEADGDDDLSMIDVDAPRTP